MSRTTMPRAAPHARPLAWRWAALIAVLLVASLSVAFLVWESTGQHRQVRDAMENASEGDLEGSLVDTEVTRSLEVRRREAPGQGSSGRTSPETDAGTRPEGTPSGVSGWVVSLAAVSFVLGAGMCLALVIVRRRRRRSGGQEAEQLAGVESLPDTADATPTEEGAEQAPELSDAAEAAEGDDAVIAGVPLDPPSDAVGAPASGTSSLWVDSGVASTARTLSTAATQIVVGELDAARIEANQRLYERRSAPRVEYVHPGSLDWRGVHWEMSVRDLSGTGLRLRISPGQDAKLPAANDYVQVDFPVDGGRVRVAAQVAWRRATPEGTEMGVVFRPLVVRDVELIRETCLTRLGGDGSGTPVRDV